MGACHVLQSLDPLINVLEELIRVGNLDHLRLSVLCHPLCVIRKCAATCPKRSETPGWTTLNRRPKRRVPVARPTANDQTVFVENLIEQLVQLVLISREFCWCVFYSSIQIVAMYFDD